MRYSVNEEWFREWFGADYLALYAHRSVAQANEQVDFLVRVLARDSGSQVLDLACGSGRHLQRLVATFPQAIGGDLSAELLIHGTKEFPSLREKLLRYDMRRLPFGSEVFDLVLSLFTSFGYLPTETEDRAVLTEVQRVLRSAGTFCLDFMNAEKTIAELVPETAREVDGATVREIRSYNAATRRVEKQILIERGGKTREYLESVRAYSAAELRTLLHEAGFRERACFGDFDGSTLTPDSKRVIFLADR